MFSIQTIKLNLQQLLPYLPSQSGERERTGTGKYDGRTRKKAVHKDVPFTERSCSFPTPVIVVRPRPITWSTGFECWEAVSMVLGSNPN